MTCRFGYGPIAVVALAVLAACGSDGEGQTGPTAADGVRVASFDFAESVLLAEMYAQVIESTGTPVVRVGTVGPREIIAPALELDRIDLVPEYLGTALLFAGAPEPNPDTGSALIDLNGRLSERGLVALEPAPAEDKNVFVITKELSDREAIKNVSNLIRIAPELGFGGPPECQTRELCYAGLQSVYGLEFAEFVPQRSLPFTAEALRRGEIGVGLMFSTAATLAAFDLVELGDDRGMQPAENIVPIVRTDALERWGPDVATALDAMSRLLTTLELRDLNVQVAEELPIEDVARRWLADNDLVSGT